jgi:hypothetical protein
MHLLEFQIEEDIGRGLRMYEKMYENGSQMYLVDGSFLYHIVIFALCEKYNTFLQLREFGLPPRPLRDKESRRNIKSVKWNIVFYGDVYATF